MIATLGELAGQVGGARANAPIIVGRYTGATRTGSVFGGGVAPPQVQVPRDIPVGGGGGPITGGSTVPIGGSGGGAGPVIPGTDIPANPDGGGVVGGQQIPNPNPEPGAQASSGVPTWVWVAGGVVVAGGAVYLMRRR